MFYQVFQIDLRRLETEQARRLHAPDKAVAAAAALAQLKTGAYVRNWIVRVDDACTDPLEAVFAVANGMQHAEATLRLKLTGARSASVGDLIRRGNDGDVFLVAPTGFIKLTTKAPDIV